MTEPPKKISRSEEKIDDWDLRSHASLPKVVNRCDDL
jgi:hypothetical protein